MKKIDELLEEIDEKYFSEKDWKKYISSPEYLIKLSKGEQVEEIKKEWIAQNLPHKISRIIKDILYYLRNNEEKNKEFKIRVVNEFNNLKYKRKKDKHNVIKKA